MKKTIVLIISAFLILGLTGCAKGGKLVCTMNADEGKSTVEIEHAKDKVKTYKMITEMAIQPETADLMGEVFSGMMESFNAVKGIDMSLVTSEDKTQMTMNMFVDYTKLDRLALKVLAETFGTGASYADIFNKDVSLSEARKDLEESGYTCN